MAAQVEVQTGEVGRTGAGGRLHLSPLTDSINKNVMEIPSVSESHIIASETNKPAPNPKPRLTPKPFSVEKNPTIKPILAPKPHAKPRPESTRIAGSKSDLPNTPKPAARPVSTNPNRPAATSFRTPNKLKTGQTTKPVIQPFKPAPPLDPGEPSKSSRPVPIGRQKPAVSTLAYSKSLKTYSAAEWSGTTSNKNGSGQNKEGPITRAKSMDFLAAVGQHEDEKNKARPEAAVQLRTQPRSPRPRPVSAIFPASPAKTETPVPAPRWVARRPLSADLTSKFESIGLSLHRKSPKGDTPAEQVPPQDNEQDKTPSCVTSESTDGVADPAHSNQNDKKAEETAVNDAEQIKPVTSIKSRINLVDSSSSPGAAADLLSPVQPSPDSETSVGVKQLIKQLTEDSTPTSIPAAKPALKPRPFSSERSPDPVSLTEAADRHETSRAPQRGVKYGYVNLCSVDLLSFSQAEESTSTPNDQKMFLDLKDSPAEFRKDFIHEGSEAGQPGAPFKESGSGAELHTVRASMFENMVERQSVFMMDQDESPSATRDSPVGTFFMRRNDEDGALVTATYKEPASPSSPFWVSHAFDTVLAAEQNRAISESIPAAQWEDKAMTLRSRRSERTRPGIQITDPAPAQPASAAEPQPRFLRVGALQKWTTTGFDQGGGLDKGMLKESERDGKVASDKDRDEVAAAPKRLKILQAEEQQKPRVTYFALTGQMQELASPGGGGTSFVDDNLPFKDRSVRSALGGSQGQIFSVRRNPSLEEAFGQISPSQEKCDQFMQRNHIPSMEIRSQMDEQTKQEIIEVKEKKEQQGETERNMTKMNELEREKQKHQKVEKQRQLDLERQQFENERLRREQEKDRQRKELDRLREMEFDKAKETMERAEAEKIRHVAKQQEAERQRLKEKRQKKEEQERLWLDSHALRPKVLDLDSVLRSDAPSPPSPQHSDPSPRWREPYKPAILDIDSFTSHNQVSPSKDLFPASGFLELDVDFGVRLPPPSERDVNWKVPPQTSVGFSSPVWTTSPQDPWELRSVEMSVDKPVTEPKKAANKLSPEQLPFKQEERLPSAQQHRPAFLDEPLFLSPPSRKEPQTGISPHELSHRAPGDQIWIPREPQPPKERRGDIHSHRRSHGSQVSGWMGNVRRSFHGALSFLSSSVERGGRGEDGTGGFKRTNSLRSLASRSRESIRRFSLRSQQRLSLRRRTAPNTPTAVRPHTLTSS
ncbi:hypothetical protein GOODEAATRI_001639, partial [Goodea atripinnis]